MSKLLYKTDPARVLFTSSRGAAERDPIVAQHSEAERQQTCNTPAHVLKRLENIEKNKSRTVQERSKPAGWKRTCGYLQLLLYLLYCCQKTPAGAAALCVSSQ